VNKKLHAAAVLALFVFLPMDAKAAGLTIRLYSGGNYLQGGDLNGGLNGWTDYWKASYRESGYPNQAGSFNPVHFGFLGGGDLIFQLSPRFGIGLGAEYFRGVEIFNPDLPIDELEFDVDDHGESLGRARKGELVLFRTVG
jgi:hypothetical protein